MSRIVSLATLAAFLAGAASAQPRKPDISNDVIGVWEGPYQSEMVAPGNLRLTIARDSNQWKATLEIFSDQAPPAGELRDFTVNADTVSWVQTVGDLECASKAVLVAGVLKGLAECWQNGAVAVTASFLLEKRKTWF